MIEWIKSLFGKPSPGPVDDTEPRPCQCGNQPVKLDYATASGPWWVMVCDNPVCSGGHISFGDYTEFGATMKWNEYHDPN